MSTEYDPKIKEIHGQTSWERLFRFLETGENPMSSESKRKIGEDALEIGRKWLKEH